MKKIVGILAAAALIATSVFAADVSAKVRIDGDIFAYDGTAIDEKEGKAAGSFKLLRTSSQAREYWSPYVTLSTSTDNAGAQILFIEEADGNQNIKMARSNVWFKPLDMLKITAGFQGYNMNVESIDYSPVPTGAEDYGYGISYAQDAISANVLFVTGNNGWFMEDKIAKYNNSEDPACNYIKELYVNAAYAADFGTISAMFDFKGKELADKSCRPDTIAFGAGYKNTIDSLTFFADVVGTSYSAFSDKELAAIGAAAGKLTGEGKDATEKAIDLAAKQAKFQAYTDKDGKGRSAFGLMVDGFVQYAQDALTLKGYLRMDIYDFGHLTTKDGKKEEDMMADNNFSLGVKFRVDYALDNGITLFAQFNDANLLQKEFKNGTTEAKEWKNYSSVFNSEIKAGANIKIGVAEIETKLVLKTGQNIAYKKGVDKDTWGKYDKVNVSMPIWFQVAF